MDEHRKMAEDFVRKIWGLGDEKETPTLYACRLSPVFIDIARQFEQALRTTASKSEKDGWNKGFEAGKAVSFQVAKYQESDDHVKECCDEEWNNAVEECANICEDSVTEQNGFAECTTDPMELAREIRRLIREEK